MRYKKISSDIVDKICTLYQKGKTLNEIAVINKVSSPTVAKYLKERGLRDLSKHNINENKICRLYSEGQTVASISRITGNARMTISNLLEKRDLRKKPLAGSQRKVTEIEKTKFRELYNEGKNDQEISKAIGYSSGTVRNLRILYGLPPIKHIISDEQREAISFSKYEKRLPFYQASVRLYHKHKDWSFDQIASVVYGLCTEEEAIEIHPEVFRESSRYKVSRVKQFIGEHLMKICRINDACSFKALLPETKIINIQRRERT